MRQRFLSAPAAVLTLALLAAASSNVRAGAMIEPSSVGVTPGSGSYTWTYDEQVDNNMSVMKGDYFVIVNCYGYVPSSASGPSGWTCQTESNVGTIYGTDGSSASAPGDGQCQDLVWTYEGNSKIGGFADCGKFSFKSTCGQETDGWQLCQDHDFWGYNSDCSKGDCKTPCPTSSAPLPSVSFAGLGLFGLLAIGRMLKSRKLA